jgi:MinD-like ATPase involved in chromosome partitioning or flagellar assembly/CheY-like chemotaxis protein
MAPAIKVLLIEDNRIEARLTQHWLASAKDPLFEADSVDQLQAGIDRLTLGGIDIVLLDLNLPDSRGLETFEKLHLAFPKVPVVVLTGEYDDSIGPQAVERGAQDYLVKQNTDAYSLARVLRLALARQISSQKQGSAPEIKAAPRAIGFIGAKGGVGTTTTALNVAMALSIFGHPTILVEMHPSFGTLSCHVSWKPKTNLKDLLDEPSESIDPKELATVLHKLSIDNLRILVGPQQASESRDIDPKQATAIITNLMTMCDFVVLDLPSFPSPATRAALGLCHDIFVVTEREPAAIKSGQVAVHQLQIWKLDQRLSGAILVVKSNFPIPIELTEVRSVMGCPIVAIVPMASTPLLQSLKDGIPLVEAQANSDAAVNIKDFTRKMIAIKLSDIAV